MKYEVTYKCGHIGTVDLFGKNAERTRKLAWYATCNCPECYKTAKVKAEERATESYDMPELTGSEKQVAWANSIRVKMYKEIDGINMESATKTAVFKFLNSKTEARFWIDNRDYYGVAAGTWIRNNRETIVEFMK